MTKVSTIFFAFFYLMMATGFNVNAHWCGNRIRFVALDSPHEKKCPCGKREMNASCCKDTHAYFKIKDTQKMSSQVVPPSNESAKSLRVFAFMKPEELFQQVDAFDIANYHAPPFKTKLPAYLTSSVLRI